MDLGFGCTSPNVVNVYEGRDHHIALMYNRDHVQKNIISHMAVSLITDPGFICNQYSGN